MCCSEWGRKKQQIKVVARRMQACNSAAKLEFTFPFSSLHKLCSKPLWGTVDLSPSETLCWRKAHGPYLFLQPRFHLRTIATPASRAVPQPHSSLEEARPSPLLSIAHQDPIHTSSPGVTPVLRAAGIAGSLVYPGCECQYPSTGTLSKSVTFRTASLASPRGRLLPHHTGAVWANPSWMSDTGKGGHKGILLRFHTRSSVSPLVLDRQWFALVLAQVQVHFSSVIFSYASQTSSTVTGLLWVIILEDSGGICQCSQTPLIIWLRLFFWLVY